MRSLLGVAVTISSLAGARFAFLRLDHDQAADVTAESRRLAEVASLRAGDATGAMLDDLRLTVHNAASNPRLAAAVQGRVDAATLKDLLSNESWWQPYRKDLSATIVYAGEVPILDQGMTAAGLSVRELVRRVRAEGSLSAFAAGKRDVFLVAGSPVATAISPRGNADAPVMLASRRLERSAIDSLAQRTQAAIALTVDGSVWAAAGETEELRVLTAAVTNGKRAPGDETTTDLSQGRPFSIHFEALAPAVKLWTGADASQFAVERAAADRTRKQLIGGAAALLAALGLFGAFWPRRRNPDAGRSGARLGDSAPGVPEDIYELAISAPHRTGTIRMGPRRLGRYTLVERIGEGGMAEIFTAVSFGTGGFRRPFVVKRLLAEMASNPQAVAQFVDEAKIQAALVHPNIVPVFDFGQIQNAYFLAQEYVAGRDTGRITRRLRDRGEPPLNVVSVLAIAHEVLAGLEYAHDRRDAEGRPLGIVHRDVTPENIMVSLRGEVKLLDFGIAKASAGRITKTDIGLVKGNVDFMSPEQARGRAVDARADLFSLGVVMYFALTGQALYPGGSLFDRLFQAAAGPGPDEERKLDALPEPANHILRKALRTEPAERFQSAAEFRAAVAPFIAGGAESLAATVAHLFGDELQREAEKIASSAGTAGTGGEPETSDETLDGTARAEIVPGS